MTWKKNSNEADDAPEVFFISEANGLNQVHLLYDMWVVVHRMLERREVDGAENCTKIHIHGNATNAYVDLVWLNSDLKQIGSWKYTIWYPKFYDIEHDEGASHFDNLVRYATFMLDEDHYGNSEWGAEYGLRPIDKYGEPVPETPHAASSLDMPRIELNFFLSNEFSTKLEEILI